MDVHSCNVLKDLKFFKMKHQENNKFCFGICSYCIYISTTRKQSNILIIRDSTQFNKLLPRVLDTLLCTAGDWMISMISVKSIWCNKNRIKMASILGRLLATSEKKCKVFKEKTIKIWLGRQRNLLKGFRVGLTIKKRLTYTNITLYTL